MRNNSKTIWMNNKSYDTFIEERKDKEQKKKKETVKKGKEKNQCYKNSKIIFKCGKSHTIGETNSTCHEIIFLVVCYTTTSDIHLVIVQY